MEWIANRYQLVRRLGRGTMSEVWLARDRVTSPEMVVALKLIPHDNDTHATIRREFFIRETTALRVLSHPRVVRLLDSGEDKDAGKLYIALEYVDGENLEDRLQKWTPPLIDSVSIGLDLLEALIAAHNLGIIHRDVKPKNVMIGADGEVKLVDFGISRLTHEARLGYTVREFMSVPYASPEQRAGEEVSTSSDLYSLGAVMFRLTTGQEPPEPQEWKPAIEAAAIPLRLKDWLLKMVCVDPAGRYRSASEAKRELLIVLEELQVGECPTYHVRVTQKCIQRLRELGHIASTSDLEAVAFISSDLGTQAHLKYDKTGQLLLIGTQIAYRCSPDIRAPLKVLALIGVTHSTPENLEYDREMGLSVRANWIVLGRQDRIPEDADIRDLLDEVEEFQRTAIRKQQEEMLHKDFLREWESVLRLERRLLEDNSFEATYQSWDISPDGTRMEITLSSQQPLIELLTKDDQMVMSHRDGKRKVAVGYFSEIAGSILVIDLMQGVRHEDIAEKGIVGINNLQAEIALSRQERAIRSLKYRECLNPNLPDVLRDPNRAQIDVSPLNICFRNERLDKAKQRAVESALRAKDLYLVQGPPGTGKSSMIAELVWQILQRNPKSRILISSQSNVAVNHLVSLIAGDYPEISIVRIGREDKIAHGAERHVLRERMREWSLQVAESSKAYVDNLEQKGMTSEELEAYLQLLNDLQATLKSLRELRERIAQSDQMLGRDGSVSKVTDRKEQGDILRKLGHLQSEEKKLLEDLQAGIEMVREVYPEIEPTDNSLSSAKADLEHHLNVRQTLQKQINALRTIQDDWLQRLGKQDDFERLLVKSVSVVAATCLGAATSVVAEMEFDWVIIDEAARATTPELLVPAVRGRRIVLVGDHRQLPPLLATDLTDSLLAEYGLERVDLETSLFERLFNAAPNELKVFLDHQYRMNEGIGRLISDVFYREQGLKSARDLSPHPLPIMPRTVVWVSTSASENRFEQGDSRSKYNPLEVNLVARLLTILRNAYLRSGYSAEKPVRVGIITGYASQARHIQQALDTYDPSYWTPLLLEVDTVDAFQGRQTQVVIYSVVRSNDDRRIGFLHDDRRLNVALSRGQDLLVIVGDHQHVKSAQTGNRDNPFLDVLRHINDHPTDCLIVKAEEIETWEA